ncbi:MAG: response regulator [Leptospiraceae bacterium]|nr:response regulator [Leptospiraceae bacterium]
MEMTEPAIIIQIDDDEINNFINESIFRANTKDSLVKSFSDPYIAIDFIRKYFIPDPMPALVFLDINMPEMSGWDVLDELKDHNEILIKFMTIYMISSSIDLTDKNKSIDSPLVKAFVSKPLSGKVIKELLVNFS